MSYTPHEWQNAEQITAEKLNHIENGIAQSGGGSGDSGVFVVSHDGATVDKTFNEIKTALDSGQPVYFFDSEGSGCIHGFVLGYMDDPSGGAGRYIKILRLSSLITNPQPIIETAYANGDDDYPWFDW